MKKQIELSSEDFRRMQLVELELLVEFDRVCRENNISYAITSGTLLGAVRHQGYIPWDDDADIVMLREEYEKFKNISYKLDSQIAYFQDHTTDANYRWGYGKLRRTGTTLVRVGQDHLKNKTGIFIDIIPLDWAPESVVGQMIQDFMCFCSRKILWSEVGKYSEKGFLRLLYSLLSKIPTETVYKFITTYTKKSKNNYGNKVRVLLMPSVGKLYRKAALKKRYALPKEWFTQLSEYDFEGHKFFGTKNYHDILTHIYGDYMKLPPIEQREPHAPFIEIKFPNQEGIK